MGLGLPHKTYHGISMTITKIGHCCLLIEFNERKILTDPGTFSSAQNTLIGIDVVLITHEHADHIHVESLAEIIKNNPIRRDVWSLSGLQHRFFAITNVSRLEMTV